MVEATRLAAARRVGLLPALTSMSITTGGLLPAFLTGALALEIAGSYGLTEPQLGLAIAAYFGASLPFLSFFGRIADTRGGYLLMAAGCVPAGASLLGIAVLSDSWHDLVWMLAIGGVGNAAIQPGANRLLASRVPAEHRGLAFGVKQAAIPMAAMVSGLAVPPAAFWIGWRATFAAAGASLVLAAVALEHHRRAEAEPRVARPVHGGRQTRPLVLLGVASCFASAAATTLGSYFVLSATAAGLSLSSAGLLAALGGASSVILRVVLGAAADHGLRSPLTQVAALMFVGAAGYAALAQGSPELMVPGVLIAYGAGWGWAGLLNYGVVRRYPLAAGAATSTTQLGTNVGAMAGSPVFALVVVWRGYSAAWAAMAALAVLAGFIVLRGSRALLASEEEG